MGSGSRSASQSPWLFLYAIALLFLSGSCSCRHPVPFKVERQGKWCWPQIYASFWEKQKASQSPADFHGRLIVVIPAPGVGWDRGCLRRARPVASQNRTKALPAETKDGEWVLGRSVVVGVTKGFFLSDLFPGYLGGSNICEMCNGTIFKMKTYCFLA